MPLKASIRSLPTADAAASSTPCDIQPEAPLLCRVRKRELPLLHPRRTPALRAAPVYKPNFTAADLQEALQVVQQLDPPGVGAGIYASACSASFASIRPSSHCKRTEMAPPRFCKTQSRWWTSTCAALQNKQHKEIGKAIGRPIEAVQQALEYIRTLDPRPGLRYNKVQARLIEPDVAFVKHGDEWLVIMNDEDLPQLRLNPAYKKLVTRDGINDKNTRDYVKERYKSAIQLIKNIEQRKQTITKVCYSHRRPPAGFSGTRH